MTEMSQNAGECAMSDPRISLPEGFTRAEISERLERTRRALGLSRAEISRSIGIQQQLWNAWTDKRKQRPNLDDAVRLCHRHKITLDWIFRGDRSGLRRDFDRALDELD